MKSYKLLALLFFIVFFSSCGNETEKKTNDQPKKAHKKSSRQEKVNKQEKYEIKFMSLSFIFFQKFMLKSFIWRVIKPKFLKKNEIKF